MKVKAIKVFIDLKEDVQRKVGDEFEVTKERFEELKVKLPDYVTEVTEPKTPRKAPVKAKETK
ncbi:hypothetical protein [Lactococcus fujiensis]|uniref:Uncharacterized protein n=1 Tax=Lactococcus fujiensis JCM 16395 TaxID=1291764 RepID=A0A2A5RIR4_9LACT|nr:hypothetical protein [Lactococcus fujiensis]PCR98987.1 hypothetical protein RT41_GL000557 [Lactococcus fujiensis JCM 16395]